MKLCPTGKPQITQRNTKFFFFNFFFVKRRSKQTLDQIVKFTIIISKIFSVREFSISVGTPIPIIFYVLLFAQPQWLRT